MVTTLDGKVKYTSREGVVDFHSISELSVFPIIIEGIEIAGLLARVLQYRPKRRGLQQRHTTDLKNTKNTEI
jgi:hypothetical protein